MYSFHIRSLSPIMAKYAVAFHESLVQVIRYETHGPSHLLHFLNFREAATIKKKKENCMKK